jgi:hypothetical protein
MLKRQKTRVLLAIVAIFIVAFGAADIGARVWLRQHNMRQNNSVFRATRPAAYKTSPYFSQEFIAEQKTFMQIAPRTFANMAGATFDGQYYSMEQGIRRVVEQPSNAKHKLYLFGSTLFNGEVPDGYTISSYLQRLAPNYAVQGIALQGGNAIELLDLLKVFDLNDGDIVVFYSGGPDTMSVYHTAVNRHNNTPFCSTLKSYLRIIEMLCVFQEMDMAALKDWYYLEREGAFVTNVYGNAIEEARGYAQQHGVNFLTFFSLLCGVSHFRPMSKC